MTSGRPARMLGPIGRTFSCSRICDAAFAKDALTSDAARLASSAASSNELVEPPPPAEEAEKVVTPGREKVVRLHARARGTAAA